MELPLPNARSPGGGEGCTPGWGWGVGREGRMPMSAKDQPILNLGLVLLLAYHVSTTGKTQLCIDPRMWGQCSAALPAVAHRGYLVGRLS